MGERERLSEPTRRGIVMGGVVKVKGAVECGRGCHGLVIACNYTYHSFLEMTEPSV